MRQRMATLLVAALTLLTGIGVAATPAQASTVHNCLQGSFCLYMNSNYGGSQTSQTSVAIMHATDQCWQLNSTWSNKTSSWVANFSMYNGKHVDIFFFDNTTCSGTDVSNGTAPQSQGSMGIYNDWLGSIALVLEQ